MIIGLFSPFCPTTLSDYRTLQTRSRADADSPFQLRLQLQTIPALIAVANVVSISAPALLPYTLLRLLRVSNGDTGFIFEGAPYKDKQLYLKPQLQEALVKGRANLTRLARKLVYPTIFTSSCAHKTPTCESARGTVLAKMYRIDGYLEPLSHQADLFSPFCAACKQTFGTDMGKGREMVWRELPSAFGLPSWLDLGKMTLATNAS